MTHDDPQDYRQMLRSPLRFTEEDLRLIREGLVALMRKQK
jgi:hypothetical protein